MGKLRHLLLAAGVVMTGGTMAQAADLPIIEAPAIEPLPIAVASGWYLRGHIGMSNQRVDKLDSVLFDEGFDIIDKEFDSAPIVGAGVGYRLNDYIRFDVFTEYRGKSSFDGFDTYDSDLDGIIDGTNEYAAKKSEWLTLANAYVDLGSWHGFSPYVGAGIGASRNTISGFTDVNVPNAGFAYADDESDWNFAWALHAGVGYEVTENLTIDLAYRYVHLGDAKSGDIRTYEGTNEFYNPLEFKDITSHDITLGFRWAFGGGAYDYEPEPYYDEEKPIVAKY